MEKVVIFSTLLLHMNCLSDLGASQMITYHNTEEHLELRRSSNTHCWLQMVWDTYDFITDPISHCWIKIIGCVF